jgi:uncharacterized protein (DUF952 family)
MLIYKISDAESWATAQARGTFDGSADDRRDGFIHLSTAAQARETVAKHFAGRDGLIIAAIETDRVADALKWEASRGGALFPHHYGPLPMSAVVWSKPLPLNTGGGHMMPDEVA